MSGRLGRAAAALVAGALALGGCSFEAYDLPLPGSPVGDDDSFEVTADFADVLNVVPRSTVMVDDVVVGEVTDVERVGWHARVTMRIRDNVDLPDNAIADIRQVSLLGEKYVALEAPPGAAGDGRLSDGDRIDMSATGRNPEVEEVLGALSFLLTGGGVAQLGTIMKEANAVMSGREGRLRNLMGSLEGVVGTIDDQKSDIIRALDSLNGLTATLNAEKDTVAEALDATGPAVRVLAAQHDELIDMLGALDDLGRVGTRVIEASKDDVLEILGHLDPVLNRLADAGDELAPGLNLLVSFPFPKSANAIVEGDYADTIMRADLDIEQILANVGVELPKVNVRGLVGRVLQSSVTGCVRSGRVTSQSCTTALQEVSSRRSLTRRCREEGLRHSPVCEVVATVPAVELKRLADREAASAGLTSLGGPGGLTRRIAEGRADPVTTTTTLLGGAV
ncbi:MCE family protein [Nocardioides sp. YIM 152588]|uniref:MCE family protein n=1 Tax=Nocardioides sp. YIM 152588 TaxID=3158259 RepID=UPI0032E450F5